MIVWGNNGDASGNHVAGHPQPAAVPSLCLRRRAAGPSLLGPGSGLAASRGGRDGDTAKQSCYGTSLLSQGCSRYHVAVVGLPLPATVGVPIAKTP